MLRSLATSIAIVACACVALSGCGSSSSSKTTHSTTDTIAKAKQKQVDRALKAAGKHRNDPVALQNLALAYIALGSPNNGQTTPVKDRELNLKKAIGALERAHKIKPKDIGIDQLLANTYLGTGQYAKAEKMLQAIAAATPKQPNVHYQLALAAQNNHNYTLAIAQWQKFVQLAPKDPRAKQVKTFISSLKASQAQAKKAKKATKTTATTTTSAAK